MNASPIVTRHASVVVSELDEDAVVRAILDRAVPLAAGAPHLVVTPNMNHVARLDTSPELAAAYDRAALILPDGWPVVRLARRLGADVSERVTGSGLVARLAGPRGHGRTIFLVGGSTAESTLRAARAFRDRGWNVLTEQAPLGWLDDVRNVEALTRRIVQARTDVVLLGVGSPKQELLGMRLLDAAGNTAVMLGVGASIDFVGGTTRRAPRWMQKLGIEWLHRIITDPRRLLARYAGDLLPFLRIARQSIKAAEGSRS